MNLFRLVVVLASMVVFCLNSPVFAQRPGGIQVAPQVKGQLTLKTTACKKNAQDNMAIYNKWKSSGCPDTFEVIGNYDFYFKRCMNDAPIVVKERQRMLADCICKKYATTAKKQNQDRIAKGCPAKPNPSWWNSNYNYHYNWCVRGANSLKAEAMNNQRAQVLKTNCKEEKPTVKKQTVKKKSIVSLLKQSDPGATLADIPYLGVVQAAKDAKLLTVTNKTPYYMTFLSKFNPSLSAAKCSVIGAGIAQEFKLLPGQTHKFTNQSLFAGKSFHVCTNSNKEFSLKLDYEYGVTY